MSRKNLAVFGLIALGISAPASTQSPTSAHSKEQLVRFDHFILGINDLDRGVADFARMTGVRPVFGGVHPGRGTQNALASLGDGVYIEILAPDPKQPNAERPIEGLTALTKLTPSGWALATTDFDALRARAGAAGLELSPTMGGSRELPDGSRLEWRTLGVVSPAHQWAPFFIQWLNPALQPSQTSPTGCTLASVSIADPNPDPLRTIFKAVGLELRPTEGEAGMKIGLQCPTGRVEF